VLRRRSNSTKQRKPFLLAAKQAQPHVVEPLLPWCTNSPQSAVCHSQARYIRDTHMRPWLSTQLEAPPSFPLPSAEERVEAKVRKIEHVAICNVNKSVPCKRRRLECKSPNTAYLISMLTDRTTSASYALERSGHARDTSSGVLLHLITEGETTQLRVLHIWAPELLGKEVQILGPTLIRCPRTQQQFRIIERPNWS
jgi:hypothetical protein